MTAAELAELELVAHMARNDMSGRARVGVAELQYLIAKVRAAEKLADVAEVALCNDDTDLADAIEDFRKAGQP